MECPYCGKKHFIPDVVYRHTESYGGGFSRFKCLHCQKVVSAHSCVKVKFSSITKTDKESDW